MKSYLFVIIISLYSLNVFSQNKMILIKDLYCKEDSLIFYLEITNITNQDITIYKPELEDICFNLLKIKFIDLDKDKVSELFPCNQIIDLDRIVLDCDNSVYLKPQDKFGRTFKFNCKTISPYLIKNNYYKLFVELNLKNVTFETVLKYPFKNDIKSNEINFLFNPVCP
jgi:hypothetical protein